MEDKLPDWFENSVNRLTATGTQRVWSVLVTIFGDLAQDKDDQISGTLITRLTSLAGIKAEATRVALHRLRKDGWIESERSGRNSSHRLTEFGRSQSATAAPRIYARRSIQPEIWHLVAADSAEVSRQELADLMLTGDYISLNSSTAIAPGAAPDGIEELLVMQSPDVIVPGWLKHRCGSAPLEEAYRGLHDTLHTVQNLLPPEGVSSPLHAAVLRVLVVHTWRRIILRHPELPEGFYPDGWIGIACRDTVHQVLDALPRAALGDLEQAV